MEVDVNKWKNSLEKVVKCAKASDDEIDKILRLSVCFGALENCFQRLHFHNSHEFSSRSGQRILSRGFSPTWQRKSSTQIAQKSSGKNSVMCCCFLCRKVSKSPQNQLGNRTLWLQRLSTRPSASLCLN